MKLVKGLIVKKGGADFPYPSFTKVCYRDFPSKEILGTEIKEVTI